MNSTIAGNLLEKNIYTLLQGEISSDRFWAKESCCKLFRRKGYYSKDRGTEIIFDVAIEIYLPGAQEFSAVVLVECKNYSHTVPVDDVEEFFAKVQQVGAANSKAILASTAPFQSGTLAFAKSKGIGLLRYFDPTNFKWELRRSPSASMRITAADTSSLVKHGLTSIDFKSDVFDLYLQSPTRATNSLWDFFEDFLIESELTPIQISQFSNHRNRLSSQVQFLEKTELEERSTEALGKIGYVSGEVSLTSICSKEQDFCNLQVSLDVPPGHAQHDNSVLGKITFNPLEIHVYKQPFARRGRDRFTLAHELAHHLLRHGRYLIGETCDEGDFVLQRQAAQDGTDIARMEFQANYFAASLLMPRTNFVADFRRAIKAFDISDKGFGALYVDNQSCNIQDYKRVTRDLMQRYGVSRTAATIRLEGLGLLRDARTNSGPRQLLSILTSPEEE